MIRHGDDAGALRELPPVDGASRTSREPEASAPDAVRSGAPEQLDFEDVYTRHFDFACRSLRLLGVHPDCLEDAAQDVFGVVARRLPQFAGDASLRTWIFAVVQRVAANHRRARRRKQDPLTPLLHEPIADVANPEAQAEAQQAAALVQSFCDGLDEPRRAVFVLALIEEVPAREIGHALGIPLFTVYSRIRSMRAALERFLEAHQVVTT